MSSDVTRVCTSRRFVMIIRHCHRKSHPSLPLTCTSTRCCGDVVLLQRGCVVIINNVHHTDCCELRLNRKPCSAHVLRLNVCSAHRMAHEANTTSIQYPGGRSVHIVMPSNQYKLEHHSNTCTRKLKSSSTNSLELTSASAVGNSN